jgi:hypothetical protein
MRQRHWHRSAPPAILPTEANRAIHPLPPNVKTTPPRTSAQAGVGGPNLLTFTPKR